MTDEQRTLSDEDITTETTGVGQTTLQQDGDAADGTDGDTQDSTDGDASDADGTDGDASDADGQDA